MYKGIISQNSQTKKITFIQNPNSKIEPSGVASERKKKKQSSGVSLNELNINTVIMARIRKENYKKNKIIPGNVQEIKLVILYFVI